jgi:hypothetical protein
MPDEFGLYLVLTDPVAGYEYWVVGQFPRSRSTGRFSG